MPARNPNRRKHSNFADYFPEERIVVTSGVILAVVTVLSFFTPSTLGRALAPLLAFAPLQVSSQGNPATIAWSFMAGLILVGVLLLYHYLRSRNVVNAG
jgi:hypothetical protein